jgi:hypothetical protein
LEDGPSEVVRPHQLALKKPVSRFSQTFYESFASRNRDVFENSPSDVEDRPIIDLQDLLPFGDDGRLIEALLAPKFVNRIHLRKRSRQVLMEREISASMRDAS